MSGSADTNFTSIIYTKLPALLSMKKSVYDHLFLILAGICLNQQMCAANIRLLAAFFTELLKFTPLYCRGRVYCSQRERYILYVL